MLINQLNTKHFSFILLLITFLPFIVYSAEVDTLRLYRLGEIRVTDEHLSRTIFRSDMRSMQYHNIQERDMLSLSEIKFYVPSIQIRTNSRGESQVFIRGSAARQTGLYFDGALMNIPWDNSMDLSLIPTDLIGSLKIDKSASSILYGPNVMGGAVNINTIERANEGYGASVRLQANDANTQAFSLLHDGRKGIFNYVTNINYLKSDGFLMPSTDIELINQNPNSNLRTNTDIERISAYVRGEVQLKNSTFGLSFNYITAEKGVAPEAHLAPQDARMWRYNDWNRMLITFNGEHNFNEEKTLQLKSTLWYDIFTQQIDSYNDISFTDRNEKQIDKDNTAGVRLALAWKFIPNNILSLVLNGMFTEHSEKMNNDAESLFSTNNISTGVEWSYSVSRLYLNSGLTIDYNEAPKTGIFTEFAGNSMTDWGAFTNIVYYQSEKLNYFLNLSRRTRFPTLRESYSGALGRFTVNPDLKAETGYLAEIGLAFGDYDWSNEFSIFVNFYDDLITRIVDPDDRTKRKRVNLGTATIFGVDYTGSYRLLNNLNLDAFITYMHTEAEDENGDKRKIDYKPNLWGSLLLSFRINSRLGAGLETEYTGEQWGLNQASDDEYIKIKPTVVVNSRVNYKFLMNNTFFGEVFLRVNNIADTYKLSQLGLPEAGRTFTIGLIFKI